MSIEDVLSSSCKFQGLLWHSNLHGKCWILDVGCGSTRFNQGFLHDFPITEQRTAPRNDLVNSIADYIDLHFEVLKKDTKTKLSQIKRLLTTVTWKKCCGKKIYHEPDLHVFFDTRLFSFGAYKGMIATNVIVSSSWILLQQQQQH